ncbi:MAG: hypothetical protein OXN89_08610 [Bryobacterales bacterium]|nr:hypothetical protein [Bryobacterales bacterium]
MPHRTSDLLSEALAAPQPLTFPQLQQALLGASRSTTFRYLSEVDYLRSYNCNGRFYTLFDAERFDRFGLLSIGTARLSRDRTLTRTVPTVWHICSEPASTLGRQYYWADLPYVTCILRPQIPQRAKPCSSTRQHSRGCTAMCLRGWRSLPDRTTVRVRPQA